ncbi:MAG: adenylosuccinate lyase [Gammaproteobacteria bacterium]|nr:adenylosuccinate lyase [Gammaproteobacteria bacterium]
MHLASISPLDGRYKERLADLPTYFSELAYLKRRVQVEVTWFLALNALPLDFFPVLSLELKTKLSRIVDTFDTSGALAIKEIEQEINHDLKAVEYWLRKKFLEIPEIPTSSLEYLHFACTSEDINNISLALQIKAFRQQNLLPALKKIILQLKSQALQFAEVAMLSRTHGQAATPTTMGKEMANYVARLVPIFREIKAMPLMGKMNGAVGNYNAHVFAYPNIDWPQFCQNLMETEENYNPQKPLGFGLQFQAFSTQVEPHDDLCRLFLAIARVNSILLDLSRNIWLYIAIDYFKLKPNEKEVGSSTMPHKINPIDFENAEGNLGLANALLTHFAEKLPNNRWQRDLSDSTVLRNLGVAFGHGLIAYQSLLSGLNKITINDEKIAKDLAQHWEILAEPMQTMLRKHGIVNAYEAIKDLTRVQKPIDQEIFVKILEQLPTEDKDKCLALNPCSYLGLASELAKSLDDFEI